MLVIVLFYFTVGIISRLDLFNNKCAQCLVSLAIVADLVFAAGALAGLFIACIACLAQCLQD